MTFYNLVLIGALTLLVGCQNKEEDKDPIEKMVKIDEEEAVEWTAPQDKQFADASPQEEILDRGRQMPSSNEELR